ncbi:MAG: hypothetical protein ABNG98_03385 [Flavobacterium sp.]|jgi:hypothetical protein
MKKIILILVTILFFNCSSRINSTNENNLIFSNKNEKIELEFLTENKFLETEVPTKVKIKTKNIKVEDLSFSAPGIKFAKTFPKVENEITLEINAKEENTTSGNFPLNVSYKKNNGELIFHKFLIPVK